VSDKLYITAALLLEQETLGPTQEDDRWAPEPVWTLRRRKLSALPGNWTPILCLLWTTQEAR